MSFYEVSKRGFDIVLSIIGLVTLSPLLIALAVIIRIFSPGPVFYRGVRTGRYGIPFWIYKFRTMVVDAEARGGTSTAKDDPRVTPIGKYLRKYKLDELPQLLNVLKGDMSFVGPRPEVAEYTDLYSGEETLILQVSPGITDYASIEFANLGDILGNEKPDQVYLEKIRPIKNSLRIKYVKERGFWLDLKLIVKTFILVLRRLVGLSAGNKARTD